MKRNFTSQVSGSFQHFFHRISSSIRLSVRENEDTERKCQKLNFIYLDADEYRCTEMGNLEDGSRPGSVQGPLAWRRTRGGARRKNRPNVHASRRRGYSATVLHHHRSPMLSDGERWLGTSSCLSRSKSESESQRGDPRGSPSPPSIAI